MLIQFSLLILGFSLGWGLYYLTIKFKKFSKTNLLIPKNKTEVMSRILYGVILGTLYFLVSDKIVTSVENFNFSQLVILFIVLAVFTNLIFLAIYDLRHFEVQGLMSLSLLIFLIALNAGLLLFCNNLSTTLLWENNFYDPLSNVFAGIIGGCLTGLIYLLTKKKGIGEGDIRMAVIMGLLLGITKLIVAFYITIFSASIIGIIYAIRIKEFKGVKIPFLPFIILGIVVAFLYSERILTIFQNIILR